MLVDTYTHVHSFKWLCSTTSVIFLIFQKVIMQCDVYGIKYLKTEMRYAIAVKTNLYNFKSSLKNKSFLQIYFFHFIHPLINHILGKVYWFLRYAHFSLEGGVRFSCLYSPHVPPKSPYIFLPNFRFVKPKLVVLDRHRSRYLRSLLMLSVKRSSQNAIFDLGETHFLTRAWTFCSWSSLTLAQ